MNDFPRLETDRLILDKITVEDIPQIVLYLQDKIFSDYTSNIPYPYRKEDAEFWLKLSAEAFKNRKGFTFAIRDKTGKFLGAIGLHDEGSDKAELGYWISIPNWNNGYVTEAAKAIIDFGFRELNFNKIYATYFPHNPASGKVMEKIGMKKEALLKQHLKKNGKYYDIPMYSIFKEDRR
ncbi:GNAT family N-acetyltransferase [Sphingobacterium detergens]|uniref:RimJ/RimL family protein N-acetyltransferase n=1 Tax=Sphingobacterium detergens TaxID=1145106 RepID=A0A420AR83_SPHD1|nr:GNAT family protein [Sphingobacterium detergens]RKE46893.1 RimJ/RimL family protein N-acetyltransferase [Sphingobacterium detergens]